jgi:hypothetical protein
MLSWLWRLMFLAYCDIRSFIYCLYHIKLLLCLLDFIINGLFVSIKILALVIILSMQLLKYHFVLSDWSSVFCFMIYGFVSSTTFIDVLSKDPSHKTFLQHPKLYGSSNRREDYNMQLFWITMIDTLWQTLVLFYIPYSYYIYILHYTHYLSSVEMITFR